MAAIYLLHNRLTFDLGYKKEINYHSWKERTKISTIARFSFKMWGSTEYRGMQSKQILYTFVLRGWKCNKLVKHFRP